jgi:hypothetical protein
MFRTKPDWRTDLLRKSGGEQKLRKKEMILDIEQTCHHMIVKNATT